MILRAYQILALPLLILLLYSKGHSQLPDYHVQVFDESYGLRTDMRLLFKDNLGFVWLMYIDRVQRFDGTQVDEFFVADGLNNIFSDRDGKVWVTSGTKVYRFENDKVGFISVEVESSKEFTIAKVFQLPGKECWLVTSIGLFKFEKEDSKFHLVTDPNFKLNTPVNTRRYSFKIFENAFIYSSRDTIWSQDMVTGEKMFLPFSNVFSLTPLNNHQLIVTSWKSRSFLCDLQEQTNTMISLQEHINDIKDDFMMVSSNLNLGNHRHLLATSKGLLEYNSITGQFVIKRLYLKGQPVSNIGMILALHLDAQQKVWACTDYTLMTFDPFRAGIGLIRNTETVPSKSFSNNIRGFAPDENNNLWMASSNGIIHWDLRKNTFEPFFAVEGAQDRMNHPSVRGIAYDGENVIIGQTNRGVWLYNPRKKEYRRPVYEAGAAGETTRRKLETDFVDQIRQLHNKDLIISSRDGGYYMEAGTYLIKQIDFPGAKENLNFCYEDQSHQIWFGTHKGLYCLDSNMVLKYVLKEGFGEGVTRCLYQWDDDEYILGAQGLFLIRIIEGKIEISVLHHFFDKDYIRNIFRDRSDRLWLSTDEGLFMFDRARGLLESYDQFDNVQGNVYNQNAYYYNPEGMLFLGGTNGINYFEPDKFEIRKDSLHVFLKKITVNQDDTSYYTRTPLLSLSPKQRSIEIEFVSPYYGNPNRLQYRYQLSGLNNEWKNIGNTNSVRFTSLQPGNYIFKVAASINGVGWYESREALLFNIAYPFWQTWWFITLSILAIAAIVFFLVRLRIRYVRKQETDRRQNEVQLITMNRDLAASQLTALRSQMNPHFIFNALNSVQRYILKGDVDQANKYLSKFSRLQREVLDNSRHDFISLEKEIEILELYLQLEQLRFDDKFEYTISVGKDIDATEIKLPPMILQPFIENAIWHGLMPRTGSKRVDIQFVLSTDELLSCRIYDNGIGRAASARLKNNHDNSTQHQSKGLSLVHERLHILEQLYQRTYRVDVVDKMDSSGVVEGTEVNLILNIAH